jgi:hypothetical protein
MTTFSHSNLVVVAIVVAIRDSVGFTGSVWDDWKPVRPIFHVRSGIAFMDVALERWPQLAGAETFEEEGTLAALIGYWVS